MQAKLRTRNGTTHILDVADISPIGCMLLCPSWRPKDNEQVSVRLDGLAPQPATLIWLEDGRAGFQFEELLAEAVLNQLLERLEGVLS